MLKKAVTVINDFFGGQDTKTPIISMALNKSPNMRNWHCAGVGNSLIKRGGFAKVNSGAVTTDNLDVFYSPGYQTTDYALRDTVARTQISQGFKPNTSSTVTKVRLWLKKTSTPTGNINIAIQTNNSGVPSGTAVTNGTSENLDISTLTTTYQWYTFTFFTNPSLTVGTQYHIVLQGSNTINGTAYAQWGVDNYDVVYPDGSISVYDASTWIADTIYDAIFEVYITGGTKGNDGFALYDFSSKNMLLGVFGSDLYKMDKTQVGTPDGVWDNLANTNTEVDYCEYATNGTAQAAYVTNDSFDSYTKTASHFDGADGAVAYTDPIAGAYTFVGNAQLDTAQYTFGTASLLLDGTGDYVTLPDSTDWYFGTEDFTIDCRVRFASVSGTQVIVNQISDGNNYWSVNLETAGIRFIFVVGGVAKANYTCSWTPSINTWYHLALERTTTTAKIFIDGVLQSHTEFTAFASNDVGNIASLLYIGNDGTGTAYFNGWIDEFRISKGVARWTSNFTPPISPYPNDLLAHSESTIKTQGGYALKGIATTGALNKTLTRTVSPVIDLSNENTLKFSIYSSRTGSNIKIGIHDSGGTTTESTPNILVVDVFQTVIMDISAVSNANKNAIDSIIITIVNADSANTFYIDNFYSASSLTSNRFLTFADWQSGRALINTDIGLYTYIGTGEANIVSAAPRGKFLTIWKNYAFIFGIRGSPNNGQYSALSDYTTWAAGNTFSNAFNTNDGDVITGVRLLKGKLYVFKRYSIFRITYLGSNPTFQVDQILNIGCPSHYSIKEVDMGGDIGTVLVFPTTDKKLAIFDGYNIQIINEVLSERNNDLFASADDQPLAFSDMDYTYADLFHAIVKTDTYEYILYWVKMGDTSVNYAFVFDYKTGGVYPYDGQIFASSCYAISTNKAKKIYCSGYTGYTWEQESGNSDDGTAINAYWVSGKIKPQAAASLLNKNLLLGINLKRVTSASTLNIGFQYRMDWNTTWTASQNFSFSHNDEFHFGKTTLFDIGSISNMFQIKLKDNSSNLAPTIYSVELHGESQVLGTSLSDEATS